METEYLYKKLDEITEKLAAAYAAKNGYVLQQMDIEEQLSAIELRMTPEGGWDGKNAEARQAARDLALSSNTKYTENVALLRTVKRDLMRETAVIEIQEARRRAIEYAIRLKVAELNVQTFLDE